MITNGSNRWKTNNHCIKKWRATAVNISRVTVNCFLFDIIVFGMLPAHGIWRETVSLLDVMWQWTSQCSGKKACYLTMIFKVFCKYGCIPGRKLPIGCLCINVVFVSKCLFSSEFNRAISAVRLSPSFAKTQELWINTALLCHYRLCDSWMMNPLLVSKSLLLETI